MKSYLLRSEDTYYELMFCAGSQKGYLYGPAPLGTPVHRILHPVVKLDAETPLKAIQKAKEVIMMKEATNAWRRRVFK